MLKSLMGACVLLLLSTSNANAGGNELAYFRVQELGTLSNASIVTGDIVPVYDASISKVRQVAADILATTATVAELNILNGLTATTTELNLGTGDLGLTFEDVTAANVLTTAECGKTMTLNSATEFSTTLPAPTGGCEFSFIISAAPVGANYTIITTGAETITGAAFDGSGGVVAAGAGTAAADTISFIASTAIASDKLNLFSDGTSWHGIAFSSASGAITYTSAI